MKEVRSRIVRVGCDVADKATCRGSVRCEGEFGLDLSIFGERFGVVQSNRGTGGIDLVCTLLQAGKRVGNAVCIVEEKVSGIDEYCAIG
jgi:hypothetical protein